ncbi:hypothetical protein [Nitrosomonas ureae]|uniref:Uncharacterized protein n=1 Tax=Nitrosomonas ureae TaxID=44577 RepID=A0A1H9A0J5_9PROT|nr:hypothetical protein [Nitrosomonas ureae]SEP70199.1 hypothetical protein SAMN05421510_100247 [Nitrosomonas ureae]
MIKNKRLYCDQLKRKLIQSLLVLLVSVLIPQTLWAAFWIDDFTGEPEEYRLVRQGNELTIEAQMLLRTGDELRVLSETGEIQLEQNDPDNNKQFILTQKNGVFRVPESSTPPDIIENMIALGEKWFEKVSEEKKSTRSLTSRGGAPVLILGASDHKNYLIAGLDALTVYWSGGEPPYRVRLLDKNDNIITEQNGIQHNYITLTDITLSTGEYGLEVLGDSSSSYIALTVVQSDQAPALYHKIHTSHVPEKVKHRYATLALASEPKWLLQSLQWAQRYGLQDFRQDILMGHVPESISK